jgi:2-acylglycerol O-acyltransferase 2
MNTDKPLVLAQWQKRILNWCGRGYRNYFPFTSVIEEPFEKDRRYLAAVVPHGMMPVGVSCLSFQLREEGFSPNTLGASAMFRIPVLRQILRVLGVVPADERTVGITLRRSFPNNVTFLVPGGIAEMFLMRDDLEQVFVKSRKGFIKLALQAGTDIVPVYMLGHTELYTVISKSSRIGQFFMDLSRRWQMSLIPFYGRWGLPLLPHAKPLVALVGKPIKVNEAVAKPSKQLVSEVHEQFLSELRRMFEKHKHLVPGYETKQLYFEDEEVPDEEPDAITADTLFPSQYLQAKL